MSHTKETRKWGLFERLVVLLLAGCATVLAGQAALILFYVSAITQDIHISTANQAETMRALLAVKTQQPASNASLDTVLHELQSNLSAIREELHA
jgi:Tfp pilus assembly protein PilO